MVFARDQLNVLKRDQFKLKVVSTAADGVTHCSKYPEHDPHDEHDDSECPQKRDSCNETDQ
jgi:hypothetical protein